MVLPSDSRKPLKSTLWTQKCRSSELSSSFSSSWEPDVTPGVSFSRSSNSLLRSSRRSAAICQLSSAKPVVFGTVESFILFLSALKFLQWRKSLDSVKERKLTSEDVWLFWLVLSNRVKRFEHILILDTLLVSFVYLLDHEQHELAPTHRDSQLKLPRQRKRWRVRANRQTCRPAVVSETLQVAINTWIGLVWPKNLSVVSYNPFFNVFSWFDPLHDELWCVHSPQCKKKMHPAKQQTLTGNGTSLVTMSKMGGVSRLFETHLNVSLCSWETKSRN